LAIQSSVVRCSSASKLLSASCVPPWTQFERIPNFGTNRTEKA